MKPTFFLDILCCPNGYYGLYGRSVKRIVRDNEQRSNWQEFATWRIENQNGLNGIIYTANTGGQQFYPVYKLGNEDFFISEEISILNMGKAICQ